MNTKMFDFIHLFQVPAFIKDANGIYLECNSAFAQFIGRPKTEIIGKTIYGIAPAEVDHEYKRPDCGLFETKINPQIYNEKLPHRDGNVYEVINFRELMPQGGGVICGMVGVTFDALRSKQPCNIPECKNVESDIYRQESFLRTITEASPLGYLVVNNITDAIIYVNPKFLQIWQLDHLQENIREGKLTHADIMPYYLALAADASQFRTATIPLQDQNNLKTVEDEMCLADGRVIRRYSTSIRDVHDNSYGRIFIFEDITERRQTELNLKESKSRYGELFDNSPAVMVIFDPATGAIVDANKAAADYYGYAINELRDMKIYSINVAESEETYNKSLVFGKEEKGRFLSKHRLRSGEIRDVEIYASRTYIGEKKLINSIVIDVTARQRAEEQLQLQSDRLSLVMEAVGAGIWDWDMTTGEVYYDKQWKAILGYEEHEIDNSIEEWYKRSHPEDADKLDQEMQDYLDNKLEKYKMEYRLRHKNGEYRWVITSGKITRDESGAPLRWAGSLTDITDRKRTEEMLRESQFRLIDFAKAIPDAGFILDEDGRYVEIFDKYDAIINKSKEEIKGKRVHETLQQGCADNLMKQVRLTITSGTNQCGVNECHTHGEKRIFEVRTAPMYYLANGKHTVAVIVNDITERINTERILQSTYELRRRSDFFNDIIDGKADFNENLAAAAKEIGLDVGQPLICCLLMSERFIKQNPAYNHDAQILKNSLIDFLKADSEYLIWDCRNYIGILCQPKKQDLTVLSRELAYQLEGKIQSHFSQLKVLIGASNVLRGFNSIKEAYRQALCAIKSLRCQCENHEETRSCCYGDLGIFQLLTNYDAGRASKFVEENIGKLIRYDKEKGADLLLTLENILQAASLKEVAEKMFFHYKTVVLRKQRIEKILGVSVDLFETRVALDAAIKLYKLQKKG